MATIKWICIFLILFIIFYILINGDLIGVKKLEQISGGTGILDKKPFYSPDNAYKLLTDLGEEGRYYYINTIIPQDIIFPITYTLFFLTINTFLLKKVFTKNKLIIFLSMLPLFGGLFDYIENIFILSMISFYPANLNTVATLSSLFTFFKSVIFIFNILTIIVTSVMILIKQKRLKITT